MARLAVIVFALAVAFVAAEYEKIQPESRFLGSVETSATGAKGIPKVVTSNLPASLNNVALSYSQNTLDSARSLPDAASQLQAKLTNYDSTQKWNVAIEPAAYYVTSYYFAQYIVNGYNVFLYTVNCK